MVKATFIIGIFLLAVITTYACFRFEKEERMSTTREVNTFVKTLKNYPLTKHQRKTLRGQAVNGDLEGAQKGLTKIMGERR